MAAQIIAIIGVGGFNSLDTRGVFLSQSRYPRFTGSKLSLPADQRFTALKNSLEEQALAVVIEANNRLCALSPTSPPR